MAKLTDIMVELLKDAPTASDRIARTRLTNGLRIAVKVEVDGFTMLQLSRLGVPPSHSEWLTVLKSFPGGGVVLGERKDGKKGQLYYLMAPVNYLRTAAARVADVPEGDSQPHLRKAD